MAAETERQQQLAQLEHLKKLGEKYYDDMYEAHSQRDATLLQRCQGLLLRCHRAGPPPGTQ